MGDVFCFLFFCVVIHGELFHDLTHITLLFASFHRIICCFSHTRFKGHKTKCNKMKDDRKRV